MGQMIVDKVITLLSEGGIRADAAYPVERITRITEPVAAVSLGKADFADYTATVLVDILAPREIGGYLCQKKALSACAILEAAGAVCSQGSCDFLSKGNVFRVSVTAVFQGIARADSMEGIPDYTIVTGPLTLSYACGFSAEQEVTTTATNLQAAPWEFTVEEFFPWGVQDTLEAEEPFDLFVSCMGKVERYELCKWIHRKRIAEQKGIRQIRTGKATGRSITSE